ncbi:MAG: DUF1186 domain-containing protein [Bacteroidia bacterium]
MTSELVVSEYKIITNTEFLNEKYNIPPWVSKQFNKLQKACADRGNKKIIDKLIALIEKYPQVPQLKNFLSVAYITQDNKEKAFEINHQVIAEHPDYLFGKINLASEYIVKGETEKVPLILGEMMDLKSLYPGRDVFLLAEITAFYQVVIYYYCAIGNFELADNRLKLLQKIAPDHQHTIFSERAVIEARHKANLKKWSLDDDGYGEFIINPVINKKLPTSLNSAKPMFNHDAISHLYYNDLIIPHEILKEIIALPRQTLISDLEKMLLDAEDRFQYFNNGKFTSGEVAFPIHAFFILKEINATESLQLILSFLENDGDFLNFWLRDHIHETLWQALYSLGFDSLNAFKKHLLKPGLHYHGKTPVSIALCQMVIHHPEKRNEIIEIYKEVFNVFNEATPDDNIVDTEFISFAVSDVVECYLPELLPLIKPLFEKDYIDVWVSRDYNDIVEEFKLNGKPEEGMELYNIYELYNDVVESWAGYKEDQKDIDDENDNVFRNGFGDLEEEDSRTLLPTSFDDYEEVKNDGYKSLSYTEQKQAVSEKINRNDPCPCGSGKKYKKCHGVND